MLRTKRRDEFATPAGVDVVELVRKTMEIEPDLRKGAKLAGMARPPYALIRKLLILQKDNLPHADIAIIEKALAIIAIDLSIKQATEMTRDILQRYWPDHYHRPRAHSMRRKTRREHGYMARKNLGVSTTGTNGFALSRFEKVITQIQVNADCSDVVIPAELSVDVMRHAVRAVNEGLRDLRAFKDRLHAALSKGVQGIRTE
jgi:hypothetical protein